MTLKKQIQKLNHYDVHDRSSFEKIGSLVLVAATLISMVVENHEASKRAAKADIVVNSNFIASRVETPEPAEKNEMVRMPIKFDDGLRAEATTGA